MKKPVGLVVGVMVVRMSLQQLGGKQETSKKGKY
jgi:hypothetical protein